MRVKVESFKIVCDCCGDVFHDGDDFVCFEDDFDGSRISNEADSSGWMVIGDKHYCPDCYAIDDEDRIVTKDGHKYDYDTSEEIKEQYLCASENGNSISTQSRKGTTRVVFCNFSFSDEVNLFAF